MRLKLIRHCRPSGYINCLRTPVESSWCPPCLTILNIRMVTCGLRSEFQSRILWCHHLFSLPPQRASRPSESPRASRTFGRYPLRRSPNPHVTSTNANTSGEETGYSPYPAAGFVDESMRVWSPLIPLELLNAICLEESPRHPSSSD